MSGKKTFTGKLHGNRPLSEEELAAMEVSEDKRLRESGIDPNGDPIAIMMEVRRRYKALKEAESKAKKED
jgi:hypothetical protein